MNDPYGALGVGYAAVRRPDTRIGATIAAALGTARTVLNVGAGAGAYEPADRAVTAVEPSATMIAQRPPGSATVVRGYAENLAFEDDAFDVGLAVLTVHHWRDPTAGLAELRRVSRRQVVLTWDPTVLNRMWLVADYLPEIADVERSLATVETVAAALPTPERTIVPVPWDCTDGFLAAYWRRPGAYLDPMLRAGASVFARVPEDAVARAVAQLKADIASRRWHRRHGHLLDLAMCDVGYRLVVSR